jgi:ABC-type multidrug transport system ATPase subunit
VRFNDVWLRYGRREAWVLRSVEVELPPGEVAVVLGRNGAGKSTLLTAAVGLLPPARGSVTGRPTVVGWVPERFPAGQPFTLRAYLDAMGRVRGLTESAAAAATDLWAQRLGLTEYLETRLSQVSKGTAQKVGLAQALLVPPQLLVLDEPWEGLDAATRAVVPHIIGQVIADGGSVLVSDHLGEVSRLPQAQHWRVEGGRVTVDSGPSTLDAGHYVVEVAVAAVEVERTVAALRADGHQVLGVRR